MKPSLAVVGAIALVASGSLSIPATAHAAAAAASSDATAPRFRELYKELIETNTSLSVGDCTLAAAIALVSSKNPSWNATLRTTCVATMLDAGHATNALPQRARANINCRIFPGVEPESVRLKRQELPRPTAYSSMRPAFRRMGSRRSSAARIGAMSMG